MFRGTHNGRNVKWHRRSKKGGPPGGSTSNDVTTTRRPTGVSFIVQEICRDDSRDEPWDPEASKVLRDATMHMVQRLFRRAAEVSTTPLVRAEDLWESMSADRAYEWHIPHTMATDDGIFVTTGMVEELVRCGHGVLFRSLLLLLSELLCAEVGPSGVAISARCRQL